MVAGDPVVERVPRPSLSFQMEAYADDITAGRHARDHPGALCELQQNGQEPAPRPLRGSQDECRKDKQPGARSPTKSKLGKLSFRSRAEANTNPQLSHESRDVSPKKPKKAKSGANLAGLLSRPKSLKNLYKTAMDDESRAKDKENTTPTSSPNTDRPPQPPPIFARFTSDNNVMQRVSALEDSSANTRPMSVQIPKPLGGLPQSTTPCSKTHGHTTRPTSMYQDQTPRSKFLSGFSHGRAKSTVACRTDTPLEPQLSPGEIGRQLEALLDRRNIPENQRYKMRNLTDTIKLEFIRQDHAEMQAAQTDKDRPVIMGSTSSAASTGTAPATSSGGNSPDSHQEQPKRGRGRSFTFSRSKKDPSSPTKKTKAEGSLGRHFRSRSTDSIASEARSQSRTSSSSHSLGTSLLSKIKVQQGPSDFVAYLRKVKQPELVEVGKLHKLRLLLRNETVAWIEDFIQQGGIQEIVSLLNRIMEVEWREEHEDALLHENLLCLKGLSTTAKAIEHLHSVQSELFPKLLHLLFDPEKKGPSEFTTRNIITSVLLTYVESASPVERMIRAKNVLGHLRDRDVKEEERPLPFVLEMRQERPYRVWCKEVVSVTKEVFWIFLHHLNVVSLPSDNAKTKQSKGAHALDSPTPGNDTEGPFGYMLRNFPQERPPVPAAPYVGGVEWDATNYLASHLDLMNAILACTPTSAERNRLRAEFRMSGWERCLGGSLRICKEKFYGSVHIALRTWVAAAAEDGWDVKDVRFGPGPETKHGRKKTGAGGHRPEEEAPPRLEMPKLDFDKRADAKDVWL